MLSSKKVPDIILRWYGKKVEFRWIWNFILITKNFHVNAEPTREKRICPKKSILLHFHYFSFFFRHTSTNVTRNFNQNVWIFYGITTAVFISNHYAISCLLVIFDYFFWHQDIWEVKNDLKYIFRGK